MPERRIGELRAGISITGNWAFQFTQGHFDMIQGPYSFFPSYPHPAELPIYYGEVRITRAEAVELARQAIRKLGIPLEAVFAEQEPRVTEPFKIGTNTVPHFRIEWLHPLGFGQAPPSVDININGNTKRVERIHFSTNKNLERPPPKVAVVPPSAPASSWPPANPEYARRLVPIAFRAIDEYGRVLSLPIPRPLTTNHVARFRLTDNGGWPHCEIELTNGWRFIYRNSMVNGHYAPDNLFNSDNRPILIKEFAGKFNLTEQQAIELVRQTIRQFNYPTNLVHIQFQPKVLRPVLAGIPRYSICWYYAPPDTHSETEGDAHYFQQSEVEAEVDADKGELKSLYYDDIAYWRHPPPIDVPITLPTPPAAIQSPTTPYNAPPAPKAPRQRLDHPLPLPR